MISLPNGNFHKEKQNHAILPSNFIAMFINIVASKTPDFLIIRLLLLPISIVICKVLGTPSRINNSVWIVKKNVKRDQATAIASWFQKNKQLSIIRALQNELVFYLLFPRGVGNTAEVLFDCMESKLFI